MNKTHIFNLIILAAIFFSTNMAFSYPLNLSDQNATLRVPVGEKNTLTRFKVESLIFVVRELLDKTDVQDLSEEDEAAIVRKVSRMITYAQQNKFPGHIIEQLKILKEHAVRVRDTSPDAYIYYGSYMPTLEKLNKELRKLGIMSRDKESILDMHSDNAVVLKLKEALKKDGINVKAMYDKKASLKVIAGIRKITKDFNISYVFMDIGISLSDVYKLINHDKALLARVGDNLALVYFENNFNKIEIKEIQVLLKSAGALLAKTDVQDLSEEDEAAIVRKVSRMITYAQQNKFPGHIIEQLKILKEHAVRVRDTSPDAYIYYGSYMPRLKAIDRELKLMHYL